MTDKKVIEKFKKKFEEQKFTNKNGYPIPEKIEQFILTTLKQYQEELVKQLEIENTGAKIYREGLSLAIEIIKKK
ncbi:hypothetical protein M0R04_10830 [Candidatus Dojkabacteria bacterium]|jgi:hypothetical protein|nr:hypothetical protein [Candidatus Dojkabacteria bacterium]